MSTLKSKHQILKLSLCLPLKEAIDVVNLIGTNNHPKTGDIYCSQCRMFKVGRSRNTGWGHRSGSNSAYKCADCRNKSV